jgi:leucyl/phenylalanyl-tRNA---protein transferase
MRHRHELPATLRLIARHWAGRGPTRGKLPDAEAALDRPDDLAGLCFDLTPQSLINGYANGLYLRSGFGPQKWWAPRRRMVLFIENFRVEASLANRLKAGCYRVSFDEAFMRVVQACAEPRPRQQSRAWIRRDLRRAFGAAHAAGFAHSVEVWDETGALAGGAYGLGIGKMFFTEAAFARAPDAAKIGLATLNCHLQRWGYLANDGKDLTGALCRQGFSPVSRANFNGFVAQACRLPTPLGRWSVDPSLEIAAWRPGRNRLLGAA